MPRRVCVPWDRDAGWSSRPAETWLLGSPGFSLTPPSIASITHPWKQSLQAAQTALPLLTRKKFKKADFYKCGWRRNDLLAPPPPFLSSVPPLITSETDSGGVGGAGGDMSLECLQMWVCELRERLSWRKAPCSQEGEWVSGDTAHL